MATDPRSRDSLLTEYAHRMRLIRRIGALRAAAILDRDTILHWNRTHQSEDPLDTSIEDAIIAWCEGKGPMPALPVDPPIGRDTVAESPPSVSENAAKYSSDAPASRHESDVPQDDSQ